MLLPLDQIQHWALYGIHYYFPVYISDIFLALLCVSYIRSKLLARDSRPLPKGLQIAGILLLGFICWVVVGGSLSVFSEVGLLSAVQLVRMLLIMYSPYMVTKTKIGALMPLRAVALAALLFESAWVISQQVHGGPLGRDIEVYLPGARFGIRSSEDESVLRMAGTFFEPSILGTYLLMHIGILFPFIVSFFRKQTYINTIAVCVAIAGSVALVFTGSRVLYGVWILTLIVAYSLLWRHNKAQHIVKLFAHWKVRVVILGIVIVVLPYVLVRLSSLSQVFTFYGSASYRIQMMIYSMRVAVGSPLLGVGMNLSPYYFATEFLGEQFVFDPTYPHNIFMQLFAETGLVGGAIFMLLAWFVLRVFVIRMHKGIINGFDFAAVLYLTCAQFYPIFLNHTELSSYFFLYVGAAMVEERAITYDA